MDSNIKPAKKPLDPIVKIGLAVLLGGFMLIFGGMYLSRPDRTIPPYSNGWQEGKVVAVHVPTWTSDPAIETLIRRFREVVLRTNDLRSLKIRPTNPEDPSDYYREVTIYIFSDPTWTEPDTLHRYLEKKEGKEEETFRHDFEQAARGGFIHLQGKTKGWLGPIPEKAKPEKDQNIQILFNDIVKDTSKNIEGIRFTTNFKTKKSNFTFGKTYKSHFLGGSDSALEMTRVRE